MKVEGAQPSSLASGNAYSATAWSDDDDEYDDEGEMDVEEAALAESKRVLKSWRKYSVD